MGFMAIPPGVPGIWRRLRTHRPHSSAGVGGHGQGKAPGKSWDSPRARDPAGAAQAASQHGLGAGTVFGELVPPARCSVPGPCQQSRASAAPSPGITACLRAGARPARSYQIKDNKTFQVYGSAAVERGKVHDTRTHTQTHKRKDSKAPNAFLALSLSIEFSCR